MTKLKPNDARVIVKPLGDPDVRPSGIVMPESAKQKPTRGEVVAVGPGATVATAHGDAVHIPLEFEIGQVVVYDKYAGLPYRAHGSDEELVILRAHDILATEVVERPN